MFLSLFTLLVVSWVNMSFAITTQGPYLEDDFKNELISFAVVKKVAKEEVLKIYIRHCGMVDVLSNSKSHTPSEGMVIKYYQRDRCVIADWVEAK